MSNCQHCSSLRDEVVELRWRLRAVERLAAALEEAAAGRGLLTRLLGPTWRSIATMIREAIA